MESRVNEEEAWQRSLLRTAPGREGSGRIRYAAAMYFYQQGQLTAELLEIYRRCCKDDHEDPVSLAEFEGYVAAAVMVPIASKG